MGEVWGGEHKEGDGCDIDQVQNASQGTGQGGSMHLTLHSTENRREHNTVIQKTYFSFFFLGYFIYLHFKCYPLSSPLPGPLPSSPASVKMLLLPPQHSGIPLHWRNEPSFTGPRASSPIDAGKCHPLLHMWLEPWVPPCVLFDCRFSPLELWGRGVWLVDIVVLSRGCKPLQLLQSFP